MNAVYGFLLIGCLWRPAPPVAAQPAATGAINLLPRYGNAPKNEQQQRADAAFLAFCDKSFPTRKAAAAHVAARGWDFLRAGEESTAIKRFNQAWLLDSAHAGAYWGFGAIMGQRQQTGESLKYLLLTQRYDSTNKQLLVDLALTRVSLYAETKQLAEVDRAIANLRRYLADSVAGRLPVRAQAYGHLASAYTIKEEYAQAWECVRLANQTVSLFRVSHQGVFYAVKGSQKPENGRRANCQYGFRSVPVGF